MCLYFVGTSQADVWQAALKGNLNINQGQIKHVADKLDKDEPPASDAEVTRKHIDMIQDFSTVADGKQNPSGVCMLESGAELMRSEYGKVLHVDGTFDVAGYGVQLVTFTIPVLGVPVHVAFGFTREKTEAAYAKLFGVVAKKSGAANNVRHCVTDWEPALRHGLQRHFPAARLHFCYFHYSHAVFGYLQKHQCEPVSLLIRSIDREPYYYY